MILVITSEYTFLHTATHTSVAPRNVILMLAYANTQIYTQRLYCLYLSAPWKQSTPSEVRHVKVWHAFQSPVLWIKVQTNRLCLIGKMCKAGRTSKAIKLQICNNLLKAFCPDHSLGLFVHWGNALNDQAKTQLSPPANQPVQSTKVHSSNTHKPCLIYKKTAFAGYFLFYLYDQSAQNQNLIYEGWT